MQTRHLRRHLASGFVALSLSMPLAPVWVGTSVPSVMAAPPRGATLSVFSSPVEVATSDPAMFAAATDGQTLHQGDTVRTGAGGSALLTFFDGSESQLGGESQVQIEQVEADPAPQIALLQTAGVTVNHVIPMPAGGSYRTDTASATGLVRGTSYIVVVGSASTCESDGGPACSAAMILLADRSGHVGRVDVSANASSTPAVALAAAGDAAAASSHMVVAAQLDSSALAQLESVAHVRDDPAASLTTELTARRLATTLAPLVVALTDPGVVVRDPRMVDPGVVIRDPGVADPGVASPALVPSPMPTLSVPLAVATAPSAARGDSDDASASLAHGDTAAAAVKAAEVKAAEPARGDAPAAHATAAVALATKAAEPAHATTPPPAAKDSKSDAGTSTSPAMPASQGSSSGSGSSSSGNSSTHSSSSNNNDSGHSSSASSNNNNNNNSGHSSSSSSSTSDSGHRSSTSDSGHNSSSSSGSSSSSHSSSSDNAAHGGKSANH